MSRNKAARWSFPSALMPIRFYPCCATARWPAAPADALLPAGPSVIEDALLQIRYGRRVVEDILGPRRRGVWP
ncbi:MAG: hypothetical protein R2864_07405 [Syntrophotaleaceae bacterium]